MTEIQSTKLTYRAPLAGYSSWRVGGLADQLFIPESSAQLCAFLKEQPLKALPLMLGLGSNTLIRDGGVRGLVIITQEGLRKLEVVEPGLIRAEAGVSCAQLARFSARLNLSGAEFFAGIPGTVGGALRMNAGCFGGETWERVASVEMVDAHGQCHIRKPSDFKIGYRHVTIPSNEWFLAATFQFFEGSKEEALTKINTLLQKRQATQPTGDHSCGSVFRNPIGDYAGRLIEACGLKGYTVGDAMVSQKHANFIINRGRATASDIEQVILEVQRTVLNKFGIQLEQEVHIVGEK